MAGVSVDEGKGSRRALDSEINMIPMIDLLMVTISFLLITAVWTHMSRLEARASVPGADTAPPCGADCPPEKSLHVEMRDPAKFLLVWKQGSTVLATSEAPRDEKVDLAGRARIVRFPALADKLQKEWAAGGAHRDPGDRSTDRVVLHTDDATPYASIVGAMDAVHGVSRALNVGGRAESVPAFHVTFAVN
jgi:biopolymer transport protein ExbD